MSLQNSLSLTSLFLDSIQTFFFLKLNVVMLWTTIRNLVLDYIFVLLFRSMICSLGCPMKCYFCLFIFFFSKKLGVIILKRFFSSLSSVG